MSGAADRAAAAMRDMGRAPMPTWRDIKLEVPLEGAVVLQGVTSIEAPARRADALPELHPNTVAVPTGRVWSPMQEAIFAEVEREAAPGEGHLVIEALAGTGKSTTIEECTRRTLEGSSVLVCAFNKSIADAMRERLAPDVDVMTLHSYGLRTLTRAAGRREIKKPDYMLGLAAEKFGNSRDTYEARSALCRLISLAKGCMIELDVDALDELADTYEIAPGDKPQAPRRGAWLQAAADILRRCASATTGPINFDDMIWLPALHGYEGVRYDWVFVDETQDLNAAQLALVKMAARGRGRVVAVGDRRQAIYGFRGADREAIPRIIRELGAKTLPLSITYRCPRAVVHEANRIVPQLQAAPSAPEGIVRDVLAPELFDEAEPGDFVLSRTNAPLISLCWKWLAAGRRAQMQGRDFAEGLNALIRQLAAKDGEGCAVAAVLNRLTAWVAKELKRLQDSERDTESLTDKSACLEAIAEGCDTAGEMIGKCDQLFAPQYGPHILCSSTHRAKGLEADRVWLLRDTYHEERGHEEQNLLYVAITRSKGELIYVYKEDPNEASTPEPCDHRLAFDREAR